MAFQLSLKAADAPLVGVMMLALFETIAMILTQPFRYGLRIIKHDHVTKVSTTFTARNHRPQFRLIPQVCLPQWYLPKLRLCLQLTDRRVWSRQVLLPSFLTTTWIYYLHVSWEGVNATAMSAYV